MIHGFLVLPPSVNLNYKSITLSKRQLDYSYVTGTPNPTCRLNKPDKGQKTYKTNISIKVKYNVVNKKPSFLTQLYYVKDFRY